MANSEKANNPKEKSTKASTLKNEVKKKTLDIKKGIVVSDKMDKTVVVKVSSTYPHPIYKKVVTRFKKYYAHDEQNKFKIGDQVTLVHSRPFSKLKKWRVSYKEVV